MGWATTLQAHPTNAGDRRQSTHIRAVPILRRRRVPSEPLACCALCRALVRWRGWWGRRRFPRWAALRRALRGERLRMRRPSKGTAAQRVAVLPRVRAERAQDRVVAEGALKTSVAAYRIRVVCAPDRPWERPCAVPGEVDDRELVVVCMHASEIIVVQMSVKCQGRSLTHVDLLAVLPCSGDQLERSLHPLVWVIPVPRKACDLAALE